MSASTIPLFKVYMSPPAAQAAAAVLNSGYIGEGETVKQFEQALEEYFQLAGTDRKVLTVNSGTSALRLALRLLDIGPGDEVISTPMTCLATNSAITETGATVVWADVHPDTGLIDPLDVAQKRTAKTKAIMVVDWGGEPCDYLSLRQIGLPIIEDAAHAIGTTYNGKHVSLSGGDYVCFSLQAIKHLTSVDGGLLVCPPVQYERAKKLRWYGFSRDGKDSFRCSQDVAELGYKMHMNNVSAAVGLANLQDLHISRNYGGPPRPVLCGGLRWVLRQHRDNAMYYETNVTSSAVRTIHLSTGPATQPPIGYMWLVRSSCWLYTVLVNDIPKFSAHMQEAGVATSPVHRRNDEFSAFAYARRPLPGVDRFFSRQVAVPVGWWLSTDDRQRVLDAMNNYRG